MTGSTQALIDQARADIAVSESRKALTKLERERSEKLAAEGAVTQAEVDAKRAADEQAEAQLAQAKARLVTAMANRSNSSGTAESARGELLAASTVDEQVESASAQLALAEARAAQAQAALDRAMLELDYTKVRAEIGGAIARRSVEPGQMRRSGPAADGGRRPRGHVGRRELQGRPDRGRCAPGQRGRDRGRHVRRHARTATSTASRRAPARASRCCRPTTRRATSPRSCSACRC